MEQYTANASITYREDLNEELAIFRVTPDEGEVGEFEPGQYAELAIPERAPDGTPGKLQRRQFSIASSPLERSHLEFYVVLVPGGALTPKLWNLANGDRVWLNPKLKGKFTLDGLPEGKHVVMVATGTGLAPFVSMVRRYHGSGRWTRASIIHCCRLSKDLGYRAELSALHEADPTFRYLPTLTREKSTDWNGLCGRVQHLLQPGSFQELTGAPLDPETTEFYLCGNPEMIEQTIETLKAHGFKEHHKKDPGQIHFERFW